jgi:glutamate synthase (NADPH/NADH) large chain
MTTAAFYEYHAALMEPWDGPAAVAFTDGRQIGATLDRNGLRPARYIVTDDGFVIMASEAGTLGAEEKIVRKWRLQPGKMLLIDLEEGRIISDDEDQARAATANPYADWLDRTQIVLEDLPGRSAPPRADDQALLDRQQAFGYTQEDLKIPAGADGDTGQEAHRLHGHRHADLGAVGQVRSCSTPISSRTSRRSPTRRSTRSARNW